jgi:hypothetical protein
MPDPVSRMDERPAAAFQRTEKGDDRTLPL